MVVSPLTGTEKTAVVVPAGIVTTIDLAVKSPGATAEALAVLAVTLTSRPLKADSEMVKFRLWLLLFPSTVDASPIDTVGMASLSLIVTTAVPPTASIAAFCGADKVALKVSLSSSRMSLINGTATV